jgi:SAM-dependent methyltransferase
MDSQNQKDLALESGNWLSVSRISLVCGLIEQNLRIQHSAGKGISILDFGAGAGEGIQFWRKYGEVDVVEPGNFFLSLLQKSSFIRTILSRDWEEKLPHDAYDFVLLLDVIEHLDFPNRVLSRLSYSMKKGGYLIITVPAYQWLFSNHDVALDHRKRYTRKTLKNEIPKNFELIKISHFVTTLFPIAVITRLFSRLRYLLFASQDSKRNIRKQSSSQLSFLDIILKKIMSIEVNKIVNGGNTDFGLSIVAVFRKI